MAELGLVQGIPGQLLFNQPALRLFGVDEINADPAGIQCLRYSIVHKTARKDSK
jgi:hypothetical protein